MFTPAPFANSKLNPAISISAGNNQTASQGQAVATAPRVLVADGRGNPISGVSVTFAVTGGGGSVAGGSQTTNASGLATATSWTLGTTAGSAQALRCTLNGFQGTAPFVDFAATVAAASTIAVNGGNNQTANVSTAVATAPSVIVRDTLNNPCSGISVTWAVTAGGGSATGTSTTTNGSGIAQVGSWTLGASAGANTLQATSAGLSGSPVSFSATAVQPKTLTYQVQSNTWNSANPGTFSGVSIGSAAADRRVIVSIHSSDAITITDVTIGGQAATIAVESDGPSSTTAIAIAAVPSGTTADVVITMDSLPSDLAIGVWSCTGLSSNTPVSTGVSSADPSTATLTTSDGGFCIAACSLRGTSTVSWSGVTERFDNQGGTHMWSGADATTNGSNISPSGDYSGTGGNRSGAFATW